MIKNLALVFASTLALVACGDDSSSDAFSMDEPFEMVLGKAAYSYNSKDSTLKMIYPVCKEGTLGNLLGPDEAEVWDTVTYKASMNKSTVTLKGDKDTLKYAYEGSSFPVGLWTDSEDDYPNFQEGNRFEKKDVFSHVIRYDGTCMMKDYLSSFLKGNPALENMDKALEIARLLKKEDIHFTWVGDGQDFNRLKKTAEQEKLNISFIGFSNEPFKYLESASIYLSTARFEGLPYALIEAASVGLPIIATNVIGNNETLENGKSGYLFNTEKEAINYILCLKNNPSLYTNMVLHSQRYFEEHFSLNKMINKLEEIYQFINYSQSN